jgi:hypothetical protein
MSIIQTKYNVRVVISAVFLLCLGLVVIDYLAFNQFDIPYIKDIYYQWNSMEFYLQLLIRFLYVIIVLLGGLSLPSLRLGKEMKKEEKRKWIWGFVVMGIIITIGFVGWGLYDKYIYPVFLFMLTIVASRATAKLSNNLESENSIFGKSAIDSEFYFEHETIDDEKIRIHLPNTNIYREGLPRSGKSNLTMSELVQCVERGYPAFVYDYKGDITKKKEPELTKVLYTAYKKRRSEDPSFNYRFGIINFKDAAYSNRINLLSEKYITGFGMLENLAEILHKNLSPDDMKDDFWKAYGMIYIELCFNIVFMHKDKGLNTGAHAISLLNSKTTVVLNYAKTIKKFEKTAGSLIEAYESNAEATAIGGSVTGKTPFSRLQNEHVFWVLSGDDFDLDINNPDNPGYLCMLNAEDTRKYTTPVLAALTDRVMTELNNADRLNMYFCYDEADTMKLDSMVTFTSTGRGRGICTNITVQGFAQLKDKYKEEKATTIRGNCANFFIHQVEFNSANFYSSFFGDIKVKQTSYGQSEGSSDSISTNESLQKEKVIQARDIAGQKAGHALGRIADGEPPYFYEQFKEFKMDVEDIEPFNFPVVLTKEDDQELIARQREILEYHIIENYNKIEKEIEELLSPYDDSISDEFAEQIGIEKQNIDKEIAKLKAEEQRVINTLKEKERREVAREKEENGKRRSFIKRKEDKDLKEAQDQEEVDAIIEHHREDYEKLDNMMEDKINEIHDKYDSLILEEKDGFQNKISELQFDKKNVYKIVAQKNENTTKEGP